MGRAGWIVFVGVGLVAGGPCVLTASAQTIVNTPATQEVVPLHIDSGPVESLEPGLSAAFSRTITVPGASYVRLQFDDVVLPGSPERGDQALLEVTSLLDGAVQYLAAEHIDQWRHTSAYFNGESVELRLLVCPGTGPARVVVSGVIAGGVEWGERSLCGSTDDRTLSNDQRVARVFPALCTAWIIDDCNHCFLTAGHCDAGADIVEFNVPLSNGAGTVQHPSPDDQYAVDPSSMQTNGGQGLGNDWAYFGVFPNPNTGMTPVEAQSLYFQTSLPPAAAGQTVRVTGYGSVILPVIPQWNYVNKTHTGAYTEFIASRIRYAVDTTGGNSGSPIIDESTGVAFGIHTHAGCTISSGSNIGTGLNNITLQGVLGNPTGVCRPPSLVWAFPGGLPGYVDSTGGTSFSVVVSTDGSAVPEPTTAMLHYNDGGGWQSVALSETLPNTYDATFPAMECGGLVDWYLTAEDTDQGLHAYPYRGEQDAIEVPTADSMIVIDDNDFESAPGWTVTNVSLSDGAWELGVPAGDGTQGDPKSDFDGSGSCWLTANRAGNSDVDGGPTQLTSPRYDLTGVERPMLSYARWISNGAGSNSALEVWLSDDDGQSWTLAESIVGTGGWQVAICTITDYVAATDQVRVRFSVADNPNSAIVEAAIDRFRIVDYLCGSCVADFDGDGDNDGIDVGLFLQAYGTQHPSADLDGDGDIDGIDVGLFLQAYGIGC